MFTGHLFKRPKHFHLESLGDQCGSEEGYGEVDSFERAVILKLNGYQHWDSRSFRNALEDPPRSFRVTDCRCYSGMDPSRSHSHKRYKAACLRVVKALVSEITLEPFPGHRSDRIYIFRDLLDSSLLQHCVFGVELFVECRMLFTSVEDPSWVSRALKGETEEYRNKLLR
ncbi:hypothetical protein PM082_019006 [Marasmius tenuissimus]|nr:hypothetical protein PM082_019006 [Marasmius tenuissimus]